MDMLEPGKFGTAVPFKKRYGNYIGGEWVAPVDNQYFENITPVTGQVFCEVPRSSAADIDRALDAAHKAKAAWGRTSTTERANILNRIADRMQENLAVLAAAETWDNGKPIDRAAPRAPFLRGARRHRQLAAQRAVVDRVPDRSS